MRQRLNLIFLALCDIIPQFSKINQKTKVDAKIKLNTFAMRQRENGTIKKLAWDTNMKLLNEKVLRILSKMVNLERVEILTWDDVDRFEKNINDLCHINGSRDSGDEKGKKRS